MSSSDFDLNKQLISTVESLVQSNLSISERDTMMRYSKRREWYQAKWIKGAVVTTIIVVIFMGYRSLSAVDDATNVKPNKLLKIAQPPPKVKKQLAVQVFMESQCPDTTEFIKNQLNRNWNNFKSFIDLEIVPFGKATIEDGTNGSKTFHCQHSTRECDVNRLMCCAIARLKTADKYLPYIVCAQHQSVNQAKRCAAESGLDHAELLKCAQGKEGETLHYEAGKKTLQHKLHFIPSVFVNGKKNPAIFDDFKSGVCKALSDTSSDGKANVPDVC